MKLYTKGGDGGDTSLLGGSRVSKSDFQIEAYGTVDELNALIGLLTDHLVAEQEGPIAQLKEVQDRLFTIGANLAMDRSGKRVSKPDLTEEDILQLEQSIDNMDAGLAPLQKFILPGGHPTVSYTHLARTVCRRAERRVVSMHEIAEVDPLIIKYLNRLSDYLFVLGRHIAKELGVKEITWESRA
ncbi:cobalamin adenosyltransferase [Echinicola pacifica]|uniref:Corrinoid adenosyltransferase n=1 Tax=Echinicola pacifica TaxID=346377 RepID=A0A918Q1R0_9BACT|nr:cob(I)yrinic acid a,c-diamide adenosyltransferase [Echinicola pacifica]GGZ27734.1 cobalamin adenosyltransferase [Echinicola pacifica]